MNDTLSIKKTSSLLSLLDKIGTLRARFTINRMHYRVGPGLYALGNPGADSLVFVSANYKMSFDSLRKELAGVDAWILVIDTNGINVWCAAGKGAFGTKELINRVEIVNLKNIVNHRQLIVPQLGAPGVSAHEVKKVSGFSVIYGPVRASDIPEFLTNNMKATSQMRQVRFSFYDRLLLVPAELKTGAKFLFLIIAVFYLLSGLSKNGYDSALALRIGSYSAVNLLFAYIGGTALAPLLLPWLPGKNFSFKGLIAGLIVFLISFLFGFTGASTLDIFAWGLIMSGLASFITMNFTGSSTYTSLSGVLKEMQIAMPIQIVVVVAGTLFWLIARFI